MAIDQLASNFQHVPLIVIDVEGYEIPVLKGAKTVIAHHKPVIIVEADRENQKAAGYSLEELLQEMQNMDYTVYRLNRFGLDLAEPENSAKRNWNWIAIHNTAPDSTRKRIVHYIRRCGLVPPIPLLNPLVIS